MAHFEVEKGEIKKVTKFNSGPIGLKTTARAINPDGDLGKATISRDGVEIEMTFPQALTLANELIRRCTT